MTTTAIAAAARARDVTKVYGQGQAAVTALGGVDLGIPAGSFTAVMGPSGSGKSTLMHCMAGLDQVTSGRIWIGDTEIGSLHEWQLTRLRRNRIGFVFQAFNLLPVLTAADNITLPLDIAGRTADQAWLSTVISAVGLTDRLRHRPGELSGAQQHHTGAGVPAGTAELLTTREWAILAGENDYTAGAFQQITGRPRARWLSSSTNTARNSPSPHPS